MMQPTAGGRTYPDGLNSTRSMQRPPGLGLGDMFSAVMSNGDLIQQVMSGMSGKSKDPARPSTPQERYATCRSILSALLGVLIRITFLYSFGKEYVQVWMAFIIYRYEEIPLFPL